MADIDLDAITQRAEAAAPNLVLDAKTLADWRHVSEVDVRRIAESAADVPTLLAEVCRLRERQESHDLANEAIRQKSRALDAEATLREVGTLHRSVFYDGVEWCTECVSADDGGPVPWPCSTARILARHSSGESRG